MHLVAGIVAEGSTDVAVIEEYLLAWVARRDPSIHVEIRPIQPRIDATSGRYGTGGWTFVKAWCDKHPADARRRRVFAPLLAGERPLDFLIVQLDGDRLADYTSSYPDLTVPESADSHSRGHLLIEVLHRWLWGSIPQRTADPAEGRHCLVASIRSLEAWLVAGLDPSIPAPEEIEDPEATLMAIDPSLETKVDRGFRRLKKKAPVWRALAKRTREQLPHIYTVCPHCGLFLSYIDRVIEQRS